MNSDCSIQYYKYNKQSIEMDKKEMTPSDSVKGPVVLKKLSLTFEAWDQNWGC